MVSLVNSRGTWVLAQSRHKDKIENPGLVQQRHIENRKHADFYAPAGLLSLPSQSLVPSALRTRTEVRCLSWLTTSIIDSVIVFWLVRVFRHCSCLGSRRTHPVGVEGATMARKAPFPPSSIPAYIEQPMKLFV